MALQTKDFSVTGRSSGGGITYTYILRVTENSISVEANTSNITVEAILKQSYSGTAFTTWYTGVSCTLNGNQIFSDYKQRSLSGTAETVYYTWTGDVAHNNEGNLNLTVGGKIWQSSYASYSPPAMTIAEDASNAMPLTAIPRASTIGATDAFIGAVAMISVNQKSGSYTHSIAYQFGNLKGYISDADGNVGSSEVKLTATSIPFKVPAAFFAEIADAPSGVCTLTCRTYSGSNRIGNSQSCQFTATAKDADCKPVVSGVVVDSNPKTIALTGNEKILVQSMSTALCTIAAEARNGARLVSTSINGVEVTENTLSVPNVEAESILFSATDSRGYPGNYTAKLDIIPYTRLTCNPGIKRTDPTSGNAELTIKGNYFNGSFGAKENTLEIEYSVNGGESVKVDVVPDGEGYYVVVNVSDLYYQNNHKIEVVVSDKLETVTTTVGVGKGIPVFDWGQNDFQFHVPVQFDSTVSGVYIRTAWLYAQQRIRLQTRHPDFNGAGNGRQGIFLFGNDNGHLIAGVIGVNNAGGCMWGGMGDISLEADGAGIITIHMPYVAWDKFVLISPEYISILEETQ